MGSLKPLLQRERGRRKRCVDVTNVERRGEEQRPKSQKRVLGEKRDTTDWARDLTSRGGAPIPIGFGTGSIGNTHLDSVGRMVAYLAHEIP